MANIMTQKDIRNNVHRSGFDRSFRNCFTAKVGEILPIMCEATLPGDKVSIDMRQFMRTAPINTATFGRLRQYYDFYFVPLRLLWDKFPSWITNTNNPYHAASLTTPAAIPSEHPYFTAYDLNNYIIRINAHRTGAPEGEPTDYLNDGGSTKYYGTMKLLSYLGYGVSSATETDKLAANIAYSPWRLLGYQKIYQDWFRFGQWEDAAPWTYNLDYMMSTNNKIDLSHLPLSWGVSEPNMFDLHYCNFDKDYFLGILPSAQFGSTAVASPLQGNLYGTLSMTPIAASASDYSLHSTYNGSQFQLGTTSPAGSSAPVTAPSTFTLNANTTAGLNVLTLRYAEALQKYKEIVQSGSPDYKDQLNKVWNVDVSDDASYRCRHLGGIATDIDIQGIDSTAFTSNEPSIIGAKGLSADKGHINFDCNEYGLLYCIYHVKPIPEYYSTSFIAKENLKTTQTDYANPLFDQIGMQTLTVNELSNAPEALNTDDVLGYVPRYAEYKTAVDVVNGAFVKDLPQWVLSYDLVDSFSDGRASYLSFKVQRDFCDKMFALAADDTVSTDQFYCTAFFNANWVRNLDRDGLPY